eukprot:TRINITY_DN283_c1_g1_i1.p1 TRINITY_DN283_c1_g1~~TRINITY_DN283_c1_g1_i1.p1  ORF type:complete len:419 (+),score=97.75 TRINITY_DN283_c1_g1_i1:29-1285(+)
MFRQGSKLLRNANKSCINVPKRQFSVSKVQCTARPAVTTFSEEEEQLREMVSKFSKDVIGPKVREMDENSKMDPNIIKQCFEQGLMGVETPVEYGGSGLNFVSSCIVVEELARVDPSISVMVDIQNTLLNTAVRKWGNEQQKKKYLPMLATDVLGSFCLSETESGSDAFAMKTVAKRDSGDGSWVLNGSKCWISNSLEAGFFLVLANADPSKGYKGITAFIVHRDNPGLVIGKKEDKLGIRASSTCQVHFQDCVVKSEDVLGSIGSGYKIAIESLNEGRIGIGAQMLGLARGAFEQTMPYLNQRKQFGQAISSFQGMQFQYAQLAMDIEAAKCLVYNAARLLESGKSVRLEASYAKLYSSQMAERVATKCVELLGGVGFTREFPVEKFYRDCKVGQIYEGTTNIQLQNIAKDISKQFS